MSFGAAAAIPLKRYCLVVAINDWESARQMFITGEVVFAGDLEGRFHKVFQLSFSVGCAAPWIWIQSSSQLRGPYCNARANVKNKVLNAFGSTVYERAA